MTCRPRLGWHGIGSLAIPYVENGPHDAAHCFLFVPPFAEEMNRTRRLLSLLSQELAAHGNLCVQFDLPGTGDSPFAFESACLKDWQETVRQMIAAYQREALTVVGVRFGAALVQACTSEMRSPPPVLSIAAVNSGASALRPYARAAGIVSPATGFAAGGYTFNDDLVTDLLRFAPQIDGASALALPGGALPWHQIEPDDAKALAAVLLPQLISGGQKDE
jgi:pimeloyl-ACP methyl ester carboxylesterase